jgi:hypothetical protein
MSGELLATLVLGLLSAGFAGAELLKPPRWLRWILGLMSTGCFVAAVLIIISFAPFKLRSPITIHLQAPLVFSPSPAACTVTTKVESHLTARLYSRENLNMLRKPGSHLARLQFEELFYDWSVSVSPDKPITNLFLEVDHLNKPDVVKVRA